MPYTGDWILRAQQENRTKQKQNEKIAARLESCTVDVASPLAISHSVLNQRYHMISNWFRCCSVFFLLLLLFCLLNFLYLCFSCGNCVRVLLLESGVRCFITRSKCDGAATSIVSSSYPSRVHSLSAHSLRGGSGYDIHVESHLFDNWFEWLLSINNTLHANGGWHSHEFTWIHSHRKMHVLTQPALSLYISPAMCVQQNFTGDAHIQNAHNTRMVVVLLLNVYSSSMHFLLALRWALQAASWILTRMS